MRYSGWPELMEEKIIRDRGKPFRWGSHDCVTWACSVCETLCGINPAHGITTPCRTSRDALRIVRQHGGSILSLARECSTAHGLPEIPPALAQRGDIVCVTSDRQEPFGMALGICVGRFVMSVGRFHLVEVPMTRAVTAWRI